MLGKLLKQDFRATARIMLPLYAAVPVLGLFTNLITHLCENQNGFLIRAIGALVSFVFSLSLIAAVVTTVVLMILRFYRNLMTDEGYLMFTLPVSTTELIFSKLIVSIVWFLGTFAVDALGLLLSGTLGSYEDIVRFRFAFTFGAPYSMPTITQAQAGWFAAGVVVLVILCGLALCLMTYAAMAIGQSFKKNKGLMSVVFFFVLWIGTRMLLTLIFGLLFGLGVQDAERLADSLVCWRIEIVFLCVRCAEPQLIALYSLGGFRIHHPLRGHLERSAHLSVVATVGDRRHGGFQHDPVARNTLFELVAHHTGDSHRRRGTLSQDDDVVTLRKNRLVLDARDEGGVSAEEE